MTVLLWILGFSLLSGVLSVLAASVFLLLPESVRARLLPHFVSFAIGALLGAAFLALLPHAMEGTRDFHRLGITVLAGVLAFFLLERLVLWRHCHGDVCEVHTPVENSGRHASGFLILIGDSVHNLVDGVLIAAGFLTDIHLGIVTAIAVAAHEVPQEIGDFAILLHSGFTRGQALAYNLASSLTMIIGAVLAYWSLADMQSVIPYILAVATASFIYVAAADLIPGLHQRPHLGATAQQIVLILAGVSVIALAHSTLH
ncbi:MAG: ZIP family metal transporter [Nitrospirae bacterium]|nr:MAG: ZIP family metal transporter [Nitrospirota bacterium]